MNESSTEASSESEDMYSIVYDELRRIANVKMSQESFYSTLQATALVNEAYLRLGGDNQPRWENRAHFFGAAVQAMQRILVERARKRTRQKHGGEFKRVMVENLDSLKNDADSHEQFLMVNEALEKLAEQDAAKAELVKLRYYFGLSFEEIGDILGVSSRTAKRWWAYSKSWLRLEIASV